MHKKGFSLLELLIVLVILAILGSFLFPSLMSAKEEAKRTADASQLQQILKAYTMYVGDHEGQVPFAAYNNSKKITNRAIFEAAGLDSQLPYATWVIFLYPYLKSKEIFWSPASNINQNIFTKAARFQSGCFTMLPSWGYNGCYFSVITNGQIPKIFTKLEPINECIIEEPSNTLVFANSTSRNTPERSHISDQKADLGDYLIVPPSSASEWQAINSTSIPSPISYEHFGYLYPRFKNRTICNVGFADGHVKGVSLENLKNERIWQVKKGTLWNQN